MLHSLSIKAYFIIITILSLTNRYHALVFKFNKTYPSSVSNLLFTDLFYNYIGIELCLGTPPQCLIFNLDQSAYPLWVISNSSSSKRNLQIGFNKDQSNSISFKNEFQVSYNYDRYETAYSVLDTLILYKDNDIIPKINDAFFLLVDSFVNVDLNSGVIGLDVQNKVYTNTPGSNFIEQLKKKDIISSYQYSIQYTSDDSGEFIIGEPVKEKEETMDLIQLKTLSSGTALRWGIEIERIQSGSSFIQRNQNAALKIESGFIIGSPEYGEYITHSFFDKYLFNGKCSYVMFKINFFGYSCENIDSNIDVSTFEPLVFKMKNRVFELTAKELFKVSEALTYFMVIFPRKSFYYVNIDWILGEQFYRKYTMIFDQDKKHIGIYVPKGDNKNVNYDNDEEDNSNEIGVIFFIIGVIIGIVALIFGYIIYKKCVFKKKKQLIDFSLTLDQNILNSNN